MADLSKLILTDNTTVTLKDNSQVNSDHRHYDKDIVPLVHKKYESTSYYATAANQAESTWYFMSVKPDDWYKPWRVKFKVHSYCPAYSSYHSYTWSTFTGRSDGIAYANWNERQDSAHYYISVVPLKKAGFDAGYGHAIAVSILYGGNYTNSAYYRTFEIDYYECENCTITLLDTPVKLASWPGYNSTNYNGVGNYNAVDRGLQETGDANTVTENRIGYFPGKTGTLGVWATSLFMEDANGKYQNICQGADATATSLGTRTTAATKLPNPNGFKVLGTIWYTNTTYAANTNISGGSVVWSATSLFDSRYALNTTLTANSLTPFTEVYLVGTIHSDGLFYLDNPWWTQTPNDTSKVYVLVGACWDSTTSYCRITLYEQNKWYRYNGTNLIEISNDARTVNGHTVEKDVPGDAVFTDTQTDWNATSGLAQLLNKPTLGTASAKDVPASGNASATQVVMGNDTRLTDARTPTSHSHGNIANGGTIVSSAVTPALSDYIIISDASNSGKIERGIVIGDSTLKYLRNDGTWETLQEEKLQWGGPALAGQVSPIGVAASPEHSANRLAFLNSAALDYKYSTDGGTTWVDYTVSDYDKPKLVTEGYQLSLPIGRPIGSSDAPTLQGRTQVTITAQDGTTAYLYTRPKKMLINISSAKPLTVLVQTRTGTNYLNDGAWSNFGTFTISGWSGWSDVPLVLPQLGGGVSQTGNIWQVRFTFYLEELHATSKAAEVLGIRIFGDTSWTVNNNLAKFGHLYSFDMGQNVTFPGNLTIKGSKPVAYLSATPTSGQVVVTDGTLGGIKTTGYTIAKSVPSDAVFTDTKNTAGSTDTSSKIYLIGATSQAANPQTYSDNEVYATNGVVTTKSVQVGGGAATMQYNSTTKAVDFIFT